jgi:hypothetical protein
MSRSQRVVAQLILLAALLLQGTLQAQVPQQPPAGTDLNDPAFWAIVQNGPQSSDELEKLIRTYAANGMEDEAIDTFTSYLLRDAKDGDPFCDFCQSIVGSGHGASDESLSELFFEAADRVVEQVFQNGSGDEVYRLAVTTGASQIPVNRDRAVYFMVTAAQLGFEDEAKLHLVQLLANTGFYAEALSVAEAIHGDPDSVHYESEDIGRWIRYLTGEIERKRAIGELVLAVANR